MEGSRRDRGAGLRTDLSDPARLALIEGLELTGQIGDVDLDAIVATVAAACDVPIAVISIVVPGRQTYPSEHGLGLPFTTLPDELSLCSEVVTTGRPVFVTDARLHPAHGQHPLVLSGQVVAYAGEPLVHQGHVLGTLWVADSGPRELNITERRVLASQAQVASAVLRLRCMGGPIAVVTPRTTRSQLLERAEQALTDVPEETVVGLVVMNVVAMGALNAAATSAVGDEVLQAIETRLVDACGPGESAGSLGGDAFAVVLESAASNEQVHDRAVELSAAAAGPVVVGEATADVDLRVGAATASGSSADALLAAAEGSAIAGTPHEEPTSKGRQVGARGLQGELARAVAEGQLVLHYQPLLDLATDRMVGVEALVRWQHPTRGLLLPSAFIPLAEESGVIVELGDWVLRTAAVQAARWCSSGQPLDVAINVAAREVASSAFAQHVLETLDSAGVPVDRIVLEVTESTLIDQPHAVDTLQRLRDHGVRLALDDFGTGYSSFAYLRRFPIDILKVDSSFVAGLGKHADDEAIVASVVGLARNTGKTVVAEGVETARQATLLRALGVQHGQGFWWAEALPADLVTRWNADHAAPGSVEVDVALRLDDPRSVIMGMHEAGASMHTIAAALNAQGRRTGAGSRWHVRSVAEVVAPTQRRHSIGSPRPSGP